ncbi:MAG: hypothetical protein HDQ88_04375 [Clostridia bacterium]|nr:hypothetical protein [Clostridia bacterium]
MAVLKGKGAMTQRDLVGIWRESDVTYDSNGNMMGAYIDMQLSQCNLSPDVIGQAAMQVAFDNGEVQRVPSINTVLDEHGEQEPKGVWYSKSQIGKMAESSPGGCVSQCRFDESDYMGVCVRANIAPLKNLRTGERNMVVLLPKDPGKASTDEERTKIEKYNERNGFGPCNTSSVGLDFLSEQLETNKAASEYAYLKDNPMDVLYMTGRSVSGVSVEQPSEGFVSPVDVLSSDTTVPGFDAEDTVSANVRNMLGCQYAVPIDPSLLRGFLDRSEYPSLNDLHHDGVMAIRTKPDGERLVGEVTVYPAMEGEFVLDNLASGLMFVDGEFEDATLESEADSGIAYCFYDGFERQVENQASGLYDSERTAYYERIEAEEAELIAVKSEADLARAYADAVLPDHPSVGVAAELATTQAKPVLDERKASRRDYNNQALIGIWTDGDIKYDKNGNIKGAFIDMQVDQSHLTQEDIAAGRGYSSPSISYAFSRTPELSANKKYYTKSQLDAMFKVGSMADYGGLHGCSFTANVYTKVNKETGKSDTMVCFPMDEKNARSAEDLDKIRWYNEKNKLKGSMTKDFGTAELRSQIEVTQSVRSMTEGKARAPVKSSFVAAVENGGSHLSQQGYDDSYVEYD